MVQSVSNVENEYVRPWCILKLSSGYGGVAYWPQRGLLNLDISASRCSMQLASESWH